MKLFSPIAIGVFALTMYSQANAISVNEADQQVKDLFAHTSVKSTEVFCGFHSTVNPAPSFQCRTINYLQDKVTGQPVNAFWMTFTAPARLAGAQHYYIAVNPNSPKFAGRYHVFSNGKFDLTPAVDEVYEDASVDGDYGALLSIAGLRMHILGTPNYGRQISISVDDTRENMSIDGPIFSGYDSNREAFEYHSHLIRQHDESYELKP